MEDVINANRFDTDSAVDCMVYKAKTGVKGNV